MSNSLQPHGLQHSRLCVLTISWSLPKFMSIESVMPSNHLILYHPLLLLPSIFPSIRVFSNESVLPITWPKYWSFSFSLSPSNEYSDLISFKIDGIDLLAVQETLKSLLQHHSSKAWVIWQFAFLMVQLSHPYMTTGVGFYFLLQGIFPIQGSISCLLCLSNWHVSSLLLSPLGSPKVEKQPYN